MLIGLRRFYHSPGQPCPRQVGETILCLLHHLVPKLIVVWPICKSVREFMATRVLV